jgi:hypothetical protein
VGKYRAALIFRPADNFRENFNAVFAENKNPHTFATPFSKGLIAQPVQSICLTSRGSGVRIPLSPQIIPQTASKPAKSHDLAGFDVYTYPFHSILPKPYVNYPVSRKIPFADSLKPP